MTDINIISVHSELPANRYTADEIEGAFMRWLSDQPKDVKLRGRRVLRNAGVQHRHSFLTLDEIFTPASLTESTRRYRQAMVEHGTAALRTGLERAGIAPQDLDILITTSCTGYMIPSVDAHMADTLGLRPDLVRLPVTEMGCAAGASALVYASMMLKARPGATAAVVNIEFPTNTMQHDDFSMDNIVGTALFSDGIGCTVLRSGGPAGLATVRDFAMHQVPGTTGILGYQLTDSGLLMNLDVSLPGVIGQHFDAATAGMLGRNGLTLRDIEHFVIHPGGIKILDQIQSILDGHGGDVNRSRDIMSRYGNMSSATVIFILESLLNSRPTPGDTLLMSFGPGFGAHQLLLSVHPSEAA